ncbi:MAG: DUF402 domain-containing protein [Clostridiales bacterium]|nr:DUF402 domain-containing protein [Clostridiales bacterium]
MKQKTILRCEWEGIHSRLYAEKRFCVHGVSGIAGLMHMEAADDFRVAVGPRRVKITSNGYEWLQIAPQGKNVWATVMFDSSGIISECYFDITLENRLSDGGQSGFTDLYLDVVIAPGDKNVYVLDGDELDNAFGTGEISKAQMETAYAARDELLAFIAAHKTEFFDWCSVTRNELCRALKKVEII